ncbi:MAG: zinc-ribbon domain-containing protein [Myxococcales bacterium]|nr:zinc-ribbon domain-containing protein [Myxococcales bacterium]MDH3483574.1 zinc-ribbon domain-containing protein [Myxococcales bacterium]
MDVTCERCGTEYEFDETLLSGRGTSVKCTNCGHVFKVYPKAQEDPDRSTSTWRLLRSDGLVDTIDTLRELQRRIGSGELTPDDQISRGDEDFKPLGAIPELETFFHAAGAGERTDIPSPVPPAPTGSTSDSSLPPGRRMRQPTLLGVVPVPKPVAPATPASSGGRNTDREKGDEYVTTPVEVPGPVSRNVYTADSVRLPETESESAPAPADASDSLRLPDAGDASMPPVDPESSSFTLPERPAPSSEGDIEDAVFEEPSSSRRRSTPPPGYYEDDEDIPELPGRGWSPARWLVLLVLIGGLALMATRWQQVADILGFGSSAEEAEAAIEEGDSALAADHLEAYQSAIASYDRAIEARGGEDAQLLILLARAHALAAQAMDDGAGAGDDGPSREAHAKAALKHAEQALMFDAKGLDARLVEADALRLSGDTKRARESLEKARLMPFSRTAEFSRIDSLLQAAEHDGKLDAGLVSAVQAAERAPEGIRYRLLRARAELASGATGRARSEVEAALAINPSHPAAIALLGQLEKVAVVVVDAGAAADAGAEAEAGTEAAAAAADAGTATGTETEALAGVVAEKAVEKEAREATAAEAVGATGRAENGRRAARSRTRPEYDEYDRLAEAAGSDAFIDGRPPLRDFGWYMREGEASLAGGDYLKARALFESALEARPGSGDATDALGRVAFASGDYELSLRYFRSAAQRGHPDGYYNLGRGYERLGKTDEAVSAYYTYLKRRPSGTHVAAARAAIKKLDPRVKLPESDSESEPEPSAEPKPKPDPEPQQEPQGPGAPTQESEATPP